ncbi:MAG: c-type cytochrome [Acidobacteria bacterium]|nr:c-type cytochrome [Acidobacteriota bacterium]
MLRGLAIVFACALALEAQEAIEEPLPKENPYTSPADVARGQKLFFGHCATCHGPQGNGGRGANLARPKLRRAADDPSLFRLIRLGIPGTEMPETWDMTPREIWQVVAYVKTLGRSAVEAVPGDPRKGEELFLTKGNCGQCHTVRGRGGRMGPELTEIGARRSAAHLRKFLLDPVAEAPENPVPWAKYQAGFMQVRLTTKDGRRITGIRLNEDTYSVQVRDFSDRLFSFWKQDLVEYQKEPGKTPMPSYRNVFSQAELDDIVAFLASLRGE